MVDDQEHKLWLPFPPSVNNLYAHGVVKGRVRRFPRAKYRAWMDEAIIRLRSYWGRREPFDQPVVIKLELTPRDTRGRDADNYNKPVIDALVKARVLVDDSQRYVKAVIAYWQNPSPQPGVVVTIRLAQNVGRAPLTPAEMRLRLTLMQQGGQLTTPAGYKPSKELQSLLQKGYAEPIPGLLDGAPQGYRLAG